MNQRDINDYLRNEIERMKESMVSIVPAEVVSVGPPVTVRRVTESSPETVDCPLTVSAGDNVKLVVGGFQIRPTVLAVTA